MHRYPFFGNEQVMTHESIGLAQRMVLPIQAIRCIRKFSAQRGIREEIADASLYIYPAICFGSAGLVTDAVKCIQVFAQVKGQCAEHDTPLMKTHFTQSRVTLGSGIVQHRCKIQSFGRSPGDRFAGYGMVKLLPITITLDPTAENIIFQCNHNNRLLSNKANDW